MGASGGAGGGGGAAAAGESFRAAGRGRQVAPRGPRGTAGGAVRTGGVTWALLTVTNPAPPSSPRVGDVLPRPTAYLRPSCGGDVSAALIFEKYCAARPGRLRGDCGG